MLQICPVTTVNPWSEESYKTPYACCVLLICGGVKRHECNTAEKPLIVVFEV